MIHTSLLASFAALVRQFESLFDLLARSIGRLFPFTAKHHEQEARERNARFPSRGP